MKAPWWRHPELIWLYGAFGFVAGGFAGPFAFGYQTTFSQKVLDAHFTPATIHGNMDFAFIGGAAFFISILLGAFTGCGLVHSFGKYYRVMGWSLVYCGIFVSLISTLLMWNLSGTDGRRIAIAFDGVLVVWVIILVAWGLWLTKAPPRPLA